MREAPVGLHKPPIGNLFATEAAQRKARLVRSCQSRRRFLLRRVASFVLAIAPLFSVGLANASKDEDAPLVFLGDKDYPPAAYLEEGTPRGMDVDLAKALEAVMKREIRIELLDSNLAQKMVATGQADGLLGMSISEDRRKVFDFTEPTFTREFVFVVRSGEMVYDVSDLKRKKAGATPGGFPMKFLERRRGINVVPINSYRDGLDRLLAGTIDVMAADRWVAAYLIEKGGVHGVTILDKPFATAPSAIAVRKGNSALAEKINRAIKILKARGKISEIQESWQPQEIIFISRGRARNAIAAAVGVFLATALGVMGVWIFTLRRQARERRKREEELRWRTAFFEAQVHSAIDGILVVDSQNRKILQNQRMVDLWKIPPHIAADPDHSKQDQFLLSAVKNPQPFAEKIAHLYAHPDETSADEIELIDGTILDRYSAPVRGSDGKHYGRVWTFHDITRRKRADEALREKQAQLVLAMDISKLAHWEFDVARNLITGDEQIFRMLGTTPEQEGGLSISPEHYIRKFVHPADAALLTNEVALGVAATDPHFARQFEHRIIRADGTEGVMMTRSRIVMDAAGRTVKICGTNQDITEQKRAESVLKHSEMRFAMMFKRSPIPITLNRMADGAILDANEGFLRMSGFSREEVIGRTSLELNVYPDPRDRAFIWSQLREHGHLHAREQLFRTKSGQIRNHILLLDVISEGEEQFVLAFALDVTERTQAEERIRLLNIDLERRVQERTTELSIANARLEQISRHKDEFLANMSHELRTPLNAILGLSEALLEQVSGSLTTRQVKSLTTISTSGQHLLALINDILDLSKVETGNMELHLEPVNVPEFCESCLAFVRTQAMQKQINVSFDYDGGAANLRADPKRFKQVLVNLLSNAVKFTPEGGRIGLSVAAVPGGEDMVSFTVWDTGIGIAPTDTSRLFQAFTQIDSGLNRTQEGSGLGLALVAKLVQLHGGSVVLESELGKGSRFIVTLPRGTAGAPPDASRAPSDETPAPPHIIRRALIVDDDSSSSDQLVRYLNELGVSSTVLTRGRESMHAVACDRPDLILLDILLPDESGWVTLVKLKADPSTQAIPVVVVSVVDEPEKARNLGAAAHLTKPVSREQIAALLEQFSPRKLAPAPQPQPLAPTSGPSILLAEDNEVNVQTIGGYLEQKGYAMHYAGDGLLAVKLARELRPALILMDIQMPVMDGLTAIREIRADAALKGIPIIALTALAMPGDSARCLAAGADDYMSKPVSLKRLAIQIHRRLHK